MQNQPIVVSIAGVPMIQNKDINGDYMRTEHIVNGYPVFGKINPQNDGWSSDDLCIRMELAHRFWSVNPSPDFYAGTDKLCQILIPSDADSPALKSLEAIALNPGVMVSQFQRGAERLFFLGSYLTLKSPATASAAFEDDVANSAFAENSAAVAKHARRQQMLHEMKECYICSDDKPFAYFRVPKCGHACCHMCYERWFAANDKCGMCKQRLRDSQGNDQSNFAFEHPDSGLLFVREDDEAGAAQRTQSTHAGFQTAFEKVEKQYVVRSAAAKIGVGRRWVAV
jgi:hypothetical protein